MTTLRRWIPGALALSLVLPASAWAQGEAAAAPKAKEEAAASANAPKIQFEKDTIDLGDVIKGEKALFTYTFKNAGKSDLEIKEAKPSCGCTVAEFTRNLKPGETGKVSATIDTSRFKGPITKTVTVISNDPANGTVQLQAKANVKVIIDVLPSENVYFRVFRGDDQSSKRVLTISSEASDPFEITKIESSNPAVTTNLIKSGKAEGGEPAKAGSNYTLEVDLKKDAPIGTISGVVTLTTSHKKVPTITLNVNGQVLGEVFVTPQKVYLGQVTKETAPNLKRVVRIERRTGEGLKIEKVESSNPAIKVELETVQESKVYTVTISVAGALPDGALNANVTVRTNDKEQPLIEIPVIGTVGG